MRTQERGKVCKLLIVTTPVSSTERGKASANPKNGLNNSLAPAICPEIRYFDAERR